MYLWIVYCKAICCKADSLSGPSAGLHYKKEHYNSSLSPIWQKKLLEADNLLTALKAILKINYHLPTHPPKSILIMVTNLQILCKQYNFLIIFIYFQTILTVFTIFKQSDVSKKTRAILKMVSVSLVWLWKAVP